MITIRNAAAAILFSFTDIVCYIGEFMITDVAYISYQLLSM